MVKQSHIGFNMYYISIPMAYSNVYEILCSYALNGSIAHWGGATEMHLIDSLLDMCEVEQNLAHNNFISMIIVVHVEIDLIELPT